jgi:hypothetical protein
MKNTEYSQLLNISKPNLKVGIDKVMGLPTPHHTTPPTHPLELLRHFQATQEADFWYATLF